MEGIKLFKGGEFLIVDALPDEIFTLEDLTKEQKLIAKSAEEFGIGEVASKREELQELNPELVRSLLRKAGELGFLATDTPEVYGGSELDKVSSSLIAERIGQGVSAMVIAYNVHAGIGSLPLVLFGSPEQKKKYLPKLATGELIGAFALTEPEHGSDALGADTTAVLSDDGKHYILNGQKQFISNAGFADIFFTFAQIDGKEFTAFIVERDWEGFSLGEEEKKMGIHGSSTRPLYYQDLKVPVENVLGEIGRGHIVALNTLSVGRYKIGPGTTGASKLLLAEAIKWAKTRIQFGRPICEFGLIKHKIAEIVIRTYVNECMSYRTAYLLDLALESIDPTKEDAGNQTGGALRKYVMECSVSKIFGTESLDYIVDEVVQIMGGYGYIQDNLAEGAYRDSRVNRIWEGTNEINRLLLVGELMKFAMKGELALVDAIQKTAGELMTLRPSMVEEEGILEKEKRLVVMSKKIGLLSAGAATQKYMTKLEGEQEIIALISDMIIEIYAMESTLLRTLKKLDKEGQENANIQIAATRVFINDAFPRVERAAKQIFATIAEGEELRTQLMGLKKLARNTPINTIALRREISDSVVQSGRYHLSNV